MKKKFAIAVVFFMTYLGFLVATLPATVLLNQITLPKNIVLSGVSNTIWQVKIEQATVDKMVVNNIKTELNFWSLFTLAPRMTVIFGDAFLAGPEGELDITLSQEKIAIADLHLFIKANEIAQQFSLPVPVTAKGDVEITLPHATLNINDNKCIAAEGLVEWSKAGAIALNESIQLGLFTANVACEDGAFTLLLSPKNNLGLTLNAYVRQGGRVSGNGWLKPGAKFPSALNNALPFLGRKDDQGRYRLSF